MHRSIRKIISIIIAAVLLACMIPLMTLQSRAQTIGQAQSAALSDGVQNIVKRAKQMIRIQWTPCKDITGWGGGVTYRAGTTYTGLPYGQPVDADYVPWDTDLDGFLEAVNDPNSLMYTSRATYRKVAPYYSIDCSAFVSWAWGLRSRQTTSSIHNFATKISDSSYSAMEVGDCLCKAGDHVVLITDITYDAAGRISAVEVSESTVGSVNYLCHSVWYGSGYSYSLGDFQREYLDSGYILYRCNTRDSVTYTHSCSVPLEGDECSLCMPHAHSYRCTDTLPATCTADGILTYTCDCGSSYTEPILATGHSYRAGTTAPGCTTEGRVQYTCTACGHSYSETIPAAGHRYTSAVTPPTCTEAGFTTHTCNVCGDSYTDFPTDPAGHSYANGSCTVCGAKDEALMKGDLNGDGDVTSADAVMLARYLVDLQPLSLEQLLAADLNNDGSVTSADAVLLSKYLAGLITTLS